MNREIGLRDDDANFWPAKAVGAFRRRDCQMGAYMHRRQLGRAAVFAAVAMMLATQAAWADGPIGDGDGAVPVAASTLAFGSVCTGTTVTKPLIVAIDRQGGGAQVFANGATVSVAITSSTPASVSASGGGSIVLPGNWVTQGFDTVSSGTVTLSVVLTAATAGSVSGSIGISATGNRNSDGATLIRTTTVPVTATISNCDLTPPVLSLPAAITAEATSATGAVVTFSASASDANPASPAVTCSPASGSTFALGTTTVNCSATDAASNTASGSFLVHVVDTTAPAIVGTPGSITAEATGSSGAAVGYSSPTATDLVDGVVPVACAPVSGSVFALGVTPVTCTATDAHSNTATTGFNVTIADTTDPILALPADITAEATGPSGADVTYSASATDLVDGSVDALCSPASGSTFALGTTSVSCTATDDSGNTTSGSFNVAVEDTTAPIVTAPAPISAEAAGPSGAVATFAASASDIVDGPITPTCSPLSGSTFALGTTLVTCSATDAAGNTGTASFNVTVSDTTAPSLSLPADQQIEATGPGGAAASFSVTANDIVSGSITPVCSATTGSVFPLGTTTVTCTATDDALNVATGSFSIEVVDTTAPVLTIPASITAEATSSSGASAAFSATATDVVSGSISPICLPASGSTFALGTTTVSCTATDGAGNSTTGSFAVTVVDTTGPAITVPADITAEATGPSGALVTYSASATDLVDGSVTVWCSPASGSTFALGTTNIGCTATDNTGNSSSASFDVMVQDTTAPAITTPADITTGPTSISGATVTYSGESALDIVDGPLSATCTPPSGSLFGFGTTTVTCSATDAAGNTGTGTFTITVNGFTFLGFFQPVDMAAVNTVKNGSTVPVKFKLQGAGGLEITSTAAIATNWPKAQKIDCGTLGSLPEDAIETTATGGTSLRYDSTAQQFIYNWQTPKQPGTCWRLDVKFVDGNTKSATFKLK
jgi:hypothetical protein